MLTAELIADLYDGDCLVTTHPVTGTPLITFIHAAAAEPSIRHELLLFVELGTVGRASSALALLSAKRQCSTAHGDVPRPPAPHREGAEAAEPTRGDHLRPRRRARARGAAGGGARGGFVVCAGIHMSDIPSFPYEILWGERVLRSVANLTRADASEFLDLAPRVPVRTHVTTFALEEAEAALEAVRAGGIEGAAVIVP